MFLDDPIRFVYECEPNAVKYIYKGVVLDNNF